jgi:hypothetical protein
MEPFRLARLLGLAAAWTVLVGEDRDRTRIEYAELRRLWREKHPDDWGAAVVNRSTPTTGAPPS